MGAVAGAIASGGCRPAARPATRGTVGSTRRRSSAACSRSTVCAYLAAVYLVCDARRLDDAEMVEYFRRRAVVVAIVAGVVAFVGIFVLHADAEYIFDGLTSRALPLVIISALCGVGSLVLLLRNAARGARVLAIGAVATVVLGWGVAQWDYILPETLKVSQAAAPEATLVTILVVFIVAAIVILPVARPPVRARPEEPARARPVACERRLRPHQVGSSGRFADDCHDRSSTVGRRSSAHPRPHEGLPTASSSKLTVPNAVAAVDGRWPPDRSARRADPPGFFFDMPELTLNQAGLVVRARRVQGRDGDSHGQAPTGRADRSCRAGCRKSPNMTVEVDAMPRRVRLLGFVEVTGCERARRAGRGRRATALARKLVLEGTA